jgi:hypothetical protein
MFARPAKQARCGRKIGGVRHAKKAISRTTKRGTFNKVYGRMKARLRRAARMGLSKRRKAQEAIRKDHDRTCNAIWSVHRSTAQAEETLMTQRLQRIHSTTAACSWDCYSSIKAKRLHYSFSF